MIVDPATTRLVRTPESRTADNRSTELLEVQLLPDGPAKFKRTQEDFGAFDDQTRRALQVVASGTDKLRETLGNTMAQQANLKRVVEFDIGSPEDLTKPARLRLAGEEYGYAATKDQTAWAYVSELGLGLGPFTALVQEFGAGTPSTGKSGRTEDYFFQFPFTLERRTVITPPAGFVARQAPPFHSLPLGPLELTRIAYVQQDDSVQIVYKLECPKNRLTPVEAKAIGEELHRLTAASYIRVDFVRKSQQATSLDRPQGNLAGGPALGMDAGRLVALREYAKAADAIEANERGSANPPPQAALERLRRTRKCEDAPLSDHPAVALWQRFVCASSGAGDEKVWRNLVAPEWRDSPAAAEMQRLALLRLSAYRSLGRLTLGNPALADVVVSNVAIAAEGSDPVGYRVLLPIPGSNNARPMTLAWVVKRGGELKLLGVTSHLPAVGEEVLAFLRKGDLVSARQWLGWVGEGLPTPSFSDPLAPAAVMRLWPVRNADDPDQLAAVAASLAAPGEHYEPAIRVLRELRGRAQDTDFQVALDLAVVQGLARNGRAYEALAEATRLHERYPDSAAGSRNLAAAQIPPAR